MRRLTIWVSVLLLTGHLLTEAAPTLARRYPDILSKKVNLFWDKSYTYEMEYWWYIKSTTDDLLWVIVFFVLCAVAIRYSLRLFLIFGVYFFYHVVDMVFFWWCFKQTPWASWSLQICSGVAIVLLILPFKKQSKYKALK